LASRCCRCVGSSYVPPGVSLIRGRLSRLARATGPVTSCGALSTDGRSRQPSRRAGPISAWRPSGSGRIGRLRASPRVCSACTRWRYRWPRRGLLTGRSRCRTAWYHTSRATCGDVLAVVRQHFWGALRYATSARDPDLVEIPRADRYCLAQARVLLTLRCTMSS
jgi:hypothetical protein